MAARSGRIMVVDDEVNARTALAELLGQEGYDVETAADAVQALAQLSSFVPDLVVTDLVMPGMGGIELTKKLLAAQVPLAVVVMTASGVTSAIDAMRAGASDYLTKPIHFEELLVVIERVLEYQRLRRETAWAQERVREQLAFTSAMASSIGKGTLAIDLEGRITFLNEAGSSLLGCSDHLGKRGSEIAHLETCDGLIVESPLAIAIRTGERVVSDDHIIVRADGLRFPASYTAAPIRRDGRVTGAVVSFDDITERQQAREAQRFLLDAAVTLSASLESTAVVNAVARLGVPRLGEICFVAIVSVDNETRRVAWAHADPAAQLELDRLLGGPDRVPVFASSVAEVIATGRSMHLAIVADAWFSVSNVPAARCLGIRQALIVPLTLGTRQLGVLTLCTTGDRQYGKLDLALAEDLARRSALGIEHARLYEQACRAVALRDQALAFASHDLRAPLQTIMLAGELLRDQEMVAGRWTAGHTVEKIQNAAARMDRMIGDLVDVASIETGRFSIVMKPHAVAAIIDESTASFEAAAKAKQVKLTNDSPCRIAHISCDRDRILQVIANLLGNALKITTPGGSVCLRGTIGEREVVFSVSDTGPGIAIADHQHLFDRYWRGPTVAYQGTGLGLAIARGIVEAHRGRIWLDSELGQGTTFYFALPLAEPLRAGPSPEVSERHS